MVFSTCQERNFSVCNVRPMPITSDRFPGANILSKTLRDWLDSLLHICIVMSVQWLYGYCVRFCDAMM